MITTKEKGDKYERWVYHIAQNIIHDVNESFVIEHDKRLEGYQIDIYCESLNSIILIECKDWKDKVKHGTIDQFILKVSRIKLDLATKKKIFAIFISSSFYYENIIERIYDYNVYSKIFNLNKSLKTYRIAPIIFQDNIIIYDYASDGVKLNSVSIRDSDSILTFDDHYDKIRSIHSNLNERVSSCLKILSDYKSKNKISLITYENLSNTLYHLGHYSDAYQVSKIVEADINKFRVSSKDKVFFGTESLLVQALSFHSANKKSKNQSKPGKAAFQKLYNQVKNNSKLISDLQITPINIFIGEWISRYANMEEGQKYLNRGKEIAANTGNNYMLFTALRKLSQVSQSKREKEKYIIEAKEVIKDLEGNFQTLANEFLSHEKEKFRK